MPALKNCPRCGTEHKKRGPYCSYSCANVRVHTEEDKAVRSAKLTEYHLTPEGAATREKSSRMITAKNKGKDWEEVGVEEFAVNIPDVTDYVAEYDETWNRAERW